MNQEDRERLVRIETILTESVVPRIANHGPRIKALENAAVVATVVWGGVCAVAYVAQDAAAAWLKHKVMGHQ